SWRRQSICSYRQYGVDGSCGRATNLLCDECDADCNEDAECRGEHVVPRDFAISDHPVRASYHRWVSPHVAGHLVSPRPSTRYPVSVTRSALSAPQIVECCQYELNFDGCRVQLHRAVQTVAIYGKWRGFPAVDFHLGSTAFVAATAPGLNTATLLASWTAECHARRPG